MMRRLKNFAKLEQSLVRHVGFVARKPSFTEKNILERFDILIQIAKRLLPEYRFKWPLMHWWEDEGFTGFLNQFGETPGFAADRRWAVYQLMRLIEDVEGDTAECGVYTGATSYLICNANRQSKLVRHHHSFDSFEGLSEPSISDGDHWQRGDLVCGLDLVKKNLREFSEEVTFYKGWIPESFNALEEQSFAFLHIDVDLYTPTLDSISYFYSRISEGGVVVCDDYGFTICPGATQAIDEFLQDKPEKMVSLPDGGGFFIKGKSTSPSADF